MMESWSEVQQEERAAGGGGKEGRGKGRKRGRAKIHKVIYIKQIQTATNHEIITKLSG